MSKNTNLSFLTDFLTADIVNSRVGMNNVSPQATFDVTGTGKFSGVLTLGSTISNGTYTYTLPSATGTLALVGGAGVGTVTSVAALTLGTSGTDLSSTVANGTTTPVITLNVPTASAVNRGVLSPADWTTFNNKQNALTNPVTGTGTSGTIPVFTGSTTIGNSIIQSNATQVNIVGNGSALLFDSLGSTKNGGIQYIDDFVLNVYNSRGTGSAIELGNENLNLITDSTTRLRILDTGEVGIGTASPTGGKLVVSANSSGETIRMIGVDTIGDNYLTFVNTSATRLGYIGYGFSASNEMTISNDSDAPMSFYTNATERMRIFSDGNILIQSGGTFTNAGYKLDVNGTGRFANSTSGNILKLSTSYASGRVLNFGFSDGSVLPNAAFYIGNQTAVGVFIGDEGTTNGLYVKSNGTVGIGTTSPGSLLDISGSDSTSLDALRLRNTNSTSGGLTNLSFYNYVSAFGGTTGRAAEICSLATNFSNTGSASLLFKTTDNITTVVPAERMRITSGGNVLIGTTTDSGYKLYVNGPSYFNDGVDGLYFASTGLAYTVNANNEKKSGFYRWNSDSTNLPESGFFAVVIYGNSNNVVAQMATHFTNGNTYVRAFNTAWTAWKRLDNL